MSSTAHPRIILLPGLGADERQFDPQRPALPGLEVPPRLPNQPGESLPEYARRTAATITPSAHYFLGGTSFGGMIAQEMVQYLDPPPRAIILIASARSGEQIAPHLHYFGRFAKILPERVFEAGAGLKRLYVSKFGRLNDKQQALLAEMVSGAMPAFVRWGISAITAWPGVGELPIPVHAIHGADDELIPARLVKPEPDVVVPGAGHLVNVTHADVVNAFVLRHLA